MTDQPRTGAEVDALIDKYRNAILYLVVVNADIEANDETADEVAWASAEEEMARSALRIRLEEAEARERTFVADAKIVCDAFDDLLFVRNTDGDHKSDWALKFAEPIRALLELRQLSTPSKEQEHE